MGNFLTYTNKLRNWVPALSPQQAEDIINDAWRDIREANDSWSFNFHTEYWLAPGSISLTALTVEQFSSTVGLGYGNLPLVANLNNPPITQRQLRFGLSGGPIYSIESTDVQQVEDGAITSATTTLVSAGAPFASTDVGLLIIVEGAGVDGADLETTIASYTDPTTVELTDAASSTVSSATVTWGSSIELARVYNEGTNSAAAALLYRVYFSPLTTDFQRLDHCVDSITGYEFGYEIYQADELDRIDPMRGSQTQPYQLFFHGYDTDTNLPVYELWPGPTVQRAFGVYIWRLGLPFTDDTDALPPQLTEELLMTRAKMLAYEWAASAEPDKDKARSYMGLLSYARSRYSTEGQPGRPLGLLDQAMRRDEEVAVSQYRRRPRRPGPGWPVDSNFAQSHAIPGWWGGGAY